MTRFRLVPLLLGAAGLLVAGCSDSDGASDGSGSSGGTPTVVVTTNILGDVVEAFAGDVVDVVTVMPVGADPHNFQASAQQANEMREADALVVNGADFEEGMLDVIEAATDDGVPTYEAIATVETIEFGEGGHDHGDEHADEDGDEHAEDGDEHADEHAEDGDEHAEDDDEHAEDGDEHAEDGDEHADEHAEDGDEHAEDGDEHADEHAEDGDEHAEDDDEHAEDGDEHADEGDDHEHEHAAGSTDPHFFTDPTRMIEAVEGIADFLADNVDGIDVDALEAGADDYIAELEALDAEVDTTLDPIAEGDRVLVTNHEVFGYFADRYDFEVVGTVIPTGSTADGASAGELADLAEVIEAEGVPAIFADTSSSDELADTLADEVGDIEVVELYSESLGDEDSDGATYLQMVQTNADRIAAALG